MSPLLGPCSRCGSAPRVRRSVLCTRCHAADAVDLSPPREYEEAALALADAEVDLCVYAAEDSRRMARGEPPAEGEGLRWIDAAERRDAALRRCVRARRVR